MTELEGNNTTQDKDIEELKKRVEELGKLGGGDTAGLVTQEQLLNESKNLQSKIDQVQTFSETNFVKIPDFDKHKAQLEQNMKAINERVKTHEDKLKGHND